MNKIKSEKSSMAAKTKSVYGYCPKCGAEGIQRERCINGNDKCKNGHSYPSREAIAS